MSNPQVLAAFDEQAKYVLAEEPGTLHYYGVKPESGDRLIVIEKYKDEEAVKAHSESPRIKEFFGKIQNLLEETPKSTVEKVAVAAGFQKRE
ncbi:hypothetical protein F5884DRAFT_805674 [Xylogone sp. PMI_703]|nr:hypothetical protein F5884DRAFT_805674 [Xylogone sp. PMI_703]